MLIQEVAELKADNKIAPVAAPLRIQPTRTQPKQHVHTPPEKKTPAAIIHIGKKEVDESERTAKIFHPQYVDVYFLDGARREPILVNKKVPYNLIDRYLELVTKKYNLQQGRFEFRNAEEDLAEFAPPGGDDREPDEEHILRQLAAQWWLGTEQQMARAQQTLAAMGWEIGQDESGDDDAGVFVIRAGDINGNSYIAFPHSELSLDEGAGGTIAGAVGGGVIGSLIGHPWAGTALGAWLGSWLSKDNNASTTILKKYRAYANGKEIEPEWDDTDKWLDYEEHGGLLTKEQAVQAIVSAAEKEHNRKTQYTIVNFQTGQVVFRKYWSDQIDNDLGYYDPGWRDIHHKEIVPPTPSNPQRIDPTLDSPPVEPKSSAPTSTQTTTKISGPADFSKHGFTGYKKPGDVDEGFRVANQQIPGTKNRAQSAYYPTNTKPNVPKLDNPLTDQELARLSQLAGIKNK